MANISFTTDTRIIRDLYNTADAAQQASLELGCDGGYRTYLINGDHLPSWLCVKKNVYCPDRLA